MVLILILYSKPPFWVEPSYVTAQKRKVMSHKMGGKHIMMGTAPLVGVSILSKSLPTLLMRGWLSVV